MQTRTRLKSRTRPLEKKNINLFHWPAVQRVHAARWQGPGAARVCLVQLEDGRQGHSSGHRRGRPRYRHQGRVARHQLRYVPLDLISFFFNLVSFFTCSLKKGHVPVMGESHGLDLSNHPEPQLNCRRMVEGIRRQPWSFRYSTQISCAFRSNLIESTRLARWNSVNAGSWRDPTKMGNETRQWIVKTRSGKPNESVEKVDVETSKMENDTMIEANYNVMKGRENLSKTRLKPIKSCATSEHQRIISENRNPAEPNNQQNGD